MSGTRLVAVGPRSSERVDELARRHGHAIAGRYPCPPSRRPSVSFDDVLVDAEVLGPIGQGRPGWLDGVSRIFVLVADDDPDPMASRVPLLGRAAKRVLDVVGGLAALALFAPVIAIGAVLVRLDSRGPAFYRQVRVGLDGQQFRMWKLRTMYVDSDDRAHREYVRALMTGGAASNNGIYRVDADPRITRAGSLLRRWSIDELPQFLNVVTGEMSLVGPRPNALHETALYDGHTWQRLRVKPGVTGPWQVDARGLVPFGEMVELDLRYIRDWNLADDVRLLARTPSAVVSGDGAA